MHIFYLHGFVSSAHSTKARFLAARLAPFGLTLHCPDFNEPDFATLTTTRMLDQVDAAIAPLPPGPVVLIGSSLGAFVAWHAAARRTLHAQTPALARGDTPALAESGADAAPSATASPSAHAAASAKAAGVGAAKAADAYAAHPISRMILLAPALDFGASRLQNLGDEGLARWKATNALEVFHYAYDEPRIVHYALHDDALQYDAASVALTMPTLVLQGSRDSVVSPAMVEAFVASHANMTLRMLDDEHQLSDSLDEIWREIAQFLQLDTNAGRPAAPPTGD